MLPEINRRHLVAGAGAAFLGATAGPGRALATASTPSGSQFIRFDSEEDAFKAHFRLERDLRDTAQALTWYHFTVYGIPSDERPTPIVRYEGIEFSYFRRLGPLTWLIQAHNLSFPRSLEDGAFVDQVRNPFTGRMVRVPAMTILNDPGTLYGPAGYLTLDSKTGDWLKSYKLFRTDGDRVIMDHIRAKPASWPKPFMEASTIWCSRRDFDDPRVTSIPCEFSGIYTFPWPAWLQMGQVQGRMVGAWLGRKLPSVEELPDDFAARARAQFPELLKPRRELLDKPLPPVAAQALAAWSAGRR